MTSSESFSLSNISQSERSPRKRLLYGDLLAIVGVAVEIEGNEEVTFGVAGASSTDREASLPDFKTVSAGE
jgi:hypothetical protein